MIARRTPARGRRRAWLAIGFAAVAVGCGQSETDARLGGVLRDYVAAQDAFRADRGRYARSADSLAGRLAIPRGVKLRVRWSGPTGHVAYAWSDGAPNRYCTVLGLAGAGPSPGRAAEPACVTTEGPPLTTIAEAGRAEALEEAHRGARRMVDLVLFAIVLGVGLYPGGLALERAGRASPWIRWVAFAAPPAAATLVIAYLAGMIGTVVYAGDSPGGPQFLPGLAFAGFWLAVAVHLGLFLTPGSLSRPSRRRLRWVSGLLVMGAALYAAGVAYVASDMAHTRSLRQQIEPGTFVLMAIGVGFLALHLLGLLQLFRARRAARDSPG